MNKELKALTMQRRLRAQRLTTTPADPIDPPPPAAAAENKRRRIQRVPAKIAAAAVLAQ